MRQSVWLDVMETPFELKWIDAAGVTTRCLEAGYGPPLVLLHGTGGHLEAYARNIGQLAKRFRVIAFDMLGHGYTAKPDVPYTVDRLSDHLLAVLDAVGISCASLSGESLGGWVAAWTAAHHPERVDKLVLNTPGNILAKPEVMELVKESSLHAVRAASLDAVRARVEWLFHDKSMVTDELVEIRYRIYTQPGYLRAMQNILLLQEPDIRRHYTWSEEWVSRIQAPTLILWTSNDPTGSISEGRLLLEWLRDARLEIIQNAGHWPQWEKPNEFLDAHLRFLDPISESARK
jgi:2-hydroxy-6-oxonona-2,4-dienedioate hydrolase